jgi:hypothetical protein
LLERAVEQLSVQLAQRTSRRSFLGRCGIGIVALVGGPFVAQALRPGRAEAHHICGHTYTTNSCPHPYYPHTRIDREGWPLHPKYGYPIDIHGNIYLSREQTRRRVCQGTVRRRYPFTGKTTMGGIWSRCCHGQIRHLTDCCSFSPTRINGDMSLVGYCHHGRRVFCVMYRDTNIPC